MTQQPTKDISVQWQFESGNIIWSGRANMIFMLKPINGWDTVINEATDLLKGNHLEVL